MAKESKQQGWTAKHRYARISPRKVRLVTSLIANRRTGEALDILRFTQSVFQPIDLGASGPDDHAGARRMDIDRHLVRATLGCRGIAEVTAFFIARRNATRRTSCKATFSATN